MIRVRYENRAYHVAVYNIGCSNVIAKFDTGAVTSLVTAGCLCRNPATNFTEAFRDLVTKRGISVTNFNAADGNNMHCYPVCARNVKIGTLCIPEFYYYIAPEVQRDMFLLGDDFISCCDFLHARNGDIIVSDFDFKLYSSKPLHTNALDADEIAEVVRSEYGLLRDGTLSTVFA